MNAEGLIDREIAERLGRSLSSIAAVRRRMKLPARGSFHFGDPKNAEVVAEARRKAAEGRRRFARRHDCKSYGAYLLTRRNMKYMQQAPGCVGSAEVSVYKALMEGANLTLAELALASERYGGRRDSARRAVHRMVAAGIVVLKDGVYRLPKRRPTHGADSEYTGSYSGKKIVKIAIDGG
jgi:hypothetical protein